MSEKTYYKKITHKNGKQQDFHRYLYEQHLGRKLTRYEVVHHINGDITDNRIENLQLMTLSEHGKLHQTGKTYSAETRKKLSEHASKQDRWKQSKLTREQVKQAISDISDGNSIRKTAKKFGLSHSNLLRSIKCLEGEIN